MMEKRTENAAPTKRRVSKWEAALSVFLAFTLIFESANIQALAQGLDELTDEAAFTGEVLDPVAEPATDEAVAPEPEATEPAAEPEAAPADTTDPAPAAEPAAPAEEPAVVDEVQDIQVKLILGESRIVKYPGTERETTTAAPEVMLFAVPGEDLPFRVEPNEGNELVSVKAFVNGAEVAVVDNGENNYKVATANVTEGLSLVIETKAVETEPDNQPATDSTDEPATEAEAEVEPSDNQPSEEAVVDEDEAASYPAYVGYGYAGNVIVKVTASEGALPVGTQVRATPVYRQDVENAVASSVEQRGQTLLDTTAIDVTLLDAKGNEIQPAKDVNVCFFDAGMDSGEISVYRVSDNADSVEVIGARQADANVQSFDVSHFTIYVVAATGTPKRATYEFYGADGQLINTQIVKNGDTLYEPGVDKSVDGKKFVGWTTAQDDESSLVADIFGAVSGVSQDTTIKLYACYEPAYYVFFMDNQGRVGETREATVGSTVDTTNVRLQLDTTHSVTGWYQTADLDKNGAKPVGDSFVMDSKNVTLYPKVEEGHYLTFVTGSGAQYIAPQFVAAGQKTAQPAAPTRAGYTFAGWFADEGLKTKFVFGQTIDEAQTAYAKWNANKNVKYTVNYWTENADDNEYGYVSSVVRQGTAGDSVSLGSDTSKSVLGTEAQYFTYNSGKTTSELSGVTIAGDGTTVVNVYFSRNTYTLTFTDDVTVFVEGYGPGTAWHIVDGEYKHGRWTTRTETVATITAKYNAAIADEFSKAPFSTTYNGRAWEDTGNTYAYALQTLDRMPGTNVAFKLYQKSSNNKKTIYYYMQNVDSTLNTWPTTSKQVNSNYTLGKTVDTYFNFATYNEEYHEIEGFTRFTRTEAGFNASNRKDFSNKRLDLYYKRNSYKLEFVSNGQTVKTDTVKYEAALDRYLAYRPDKPADLPEGYEFQGWFMDKDCTPGTEVSLKNMPASNVKVYAKWAAPTYDVAAKLSLASDAGVYDFEVALGSIISKNMLPNVVDSQGAILEQGNNDPAYKVTVDTNKGYKWIGWAEKNADGTFTLFNFGEQLNRNVTLYPYYVDGSNFAVTYSAGDGAGTVPVDNNKYAQDSYAEVASAKTLIAPEGKVFLAWTDGSHTYYPKDKVQVHSDVTLTALWGDQQGTTSLAYNANYPDGAASEPYVVSAIANNSNVTLPDLTGVGFDSNKSDYKFVGWSKAQAEPAEPGAANPDYTVGQQVFVDMIDTNTLYGVWEKIPVLSIEAASGEKTYDGTPLTKNAFRLSGDENEYAGSKTLSNGDVLTVVVKGSITDVDDKAADNNVVTSYKVTRNGSDVSSEYKFEISAGTLTVKPCEITLRSKSDQKTYDGTALTNEQVEVIPSSGLAAGEGFDYSFTGSQTIPGESSNTFTYAPKEGTKLSNYKVTPEYGTLTVTDRATKYEVTVTANSGTEKYDGTEKAVSGLVGQLEDGSTPVTANKQTFYVSGLTAGAKGTDAGEYTANVTGTAVVKDAAGNVVTDQFEVKTVDGKLEIAKRQYSVTTNSDTKVYDGTALTAEGEIEGLVKGETVDFKVTGTQTNVGESDNTYTLAWTGSAKESNYELDSETIGKLVVTPVDIKDNPGDDPDKPSKDWRFTVNAPADVPYNGLDQAQSLIVKDSKTGRTLVKGTDYDESFSDDVKNVGTVTVTITAKGNYSGKIARKYNIISAELTIKTEGATKVYDGTALTKAEGAEINGLVNGETVDFKANGSQTEVGESDNTYSLEWTGSAKESNYKIVQENLGKLVVTAPSITNTARFEVSQPTDKVYNGLAQAEYLVVKDNVTGATLVKGVDYEETISEDVTNVGTVTVTVTGIGNYAGTVDRTYQITPAALTIVTESDSKQYDGKALKANGEISGFVNGETADFKVTGSQTKVGKSDNTYSLEWTGTAKKSNYTINETIGKLVVTEYADEIVVITTGETVVYDGQEHGATVKTPELPAGYVWGEVKSTATATNVTSADGIAADADVLSVLNAEGEDVTSKLNITKVPGTIKITPAPVTITTDGGSKVYDGEALVADAKIDGLVNGETVELKATGSQTEVGQSDNTYSIDWGTTDKNNYDVKESIGRLVVTPADITDNPEDDPDDPENPKAWRFTVDVPADVPYNGLDQAQSLTVTDTKTGKALVKGTDYDESFSEDVKNVGTVTVTITAKGNYKGEITRDYKITPAEVEVVTKGAAKVYDGTPLTAEGEIKGLVNGETVDFKTTGSQTEVGQSDNTYSLEWTGTADEGNYKLVNETIGRLVVTPADITDNPSDDPVNPDDPVDPDNPKTWRFEVSQPADVVYNATEQQQGITVTDTVTGKTLVEGTDYDVAYTAATNVGTVTVTITAKGNYSGVITRTYQITPATLLIVVNNATKVVGTADPQFTGSIAGLLGNDTLAVTYYRTNGDQAVGTYANVLSALYANNPNYTIRVITGTFTITPVPGVVPPNTPIAPIVTPVVETLETVAEPIVTPTTEPTTEPIDEPENPLAPADHVDCWVHVYMAAGMIITLIYGVGVTIRRNRFAGKLEDYEKDLKDDDDEKNNE